MPIELEDSLKMSNTKSAKAARKRREEAAMREYEAKIPLVIAEIGKCGDYSEDEKRLIFRITEMVMSEDGTAEGWSYERNIIDYISTAVNIFDMAKMYFKESC